MAVSHDLRSGSGHFGRPVTQSQNASDPAIGVTHAARSACGGRHPIPGRNSPNSAIRLGTEGKYDEPRGDSGEVAIYKEGQAVDMLRRDRVAFSRADWSTSELLDRWKEECGLPGGDCLGPHRFTLEAANACIDDTKVKADVPGSVHDDTPTTDVNGGNE